MKNQRYIVGIYLLFAAAVVGAWAFFLLPRTHELSVIETLEATHASREATPIAPANNADADPPSVPEALIAAVKQTFSLEDSRQTVTAESAAPPTETADGSESPLSSDTHGDTSSVVHENAVELPYETREFSNWQGTWGTVEVTPSGSLSLRAAADTAGAEAILPNTGNWSNYTYTVNVTVSNGDITLFARYADADNFIACNFRRNEVAVLKRENGKTEVVAAIAIPGISSEPYFIKNTWVSLRVRGKTVGCTALGGGGDNLAYTLDELPSRGGVGIQTWFHAPDAATLELREVRVEA
jgi:hypothetical protein